MSTFSVALAGAITPSGWLNAGRVELATGKFIAGATPTNFVVKYSIYTSDDGITWTARSSPLNYNGSAQQVKCLATNGTRTVAGGQNGNTNGNKVLMYSDDKGLTWTAITSPFDVTGGATSSVEGIWYSPEQSLWMAVGQAGGASKVCTSSDGITWTAVTAPNTRVGPISVTYQNSFWWVGGTGGSFNGSVGILFKSNNDGSSWTQVTTQFFDSSGSVKVLRHASSLYVVGGSKCFSCSPNFALESSPDGTTWTLRTSALTSSGSQQCRDATYSSSLGLWAAAGTSGGIVTSPDGATWTQRVTGSGVGVLWSSSQGKFVALVGTHAWTSANGTAWTDRGVVTGGEAFAAIVEIPGAPAPTYVVNEYADTTPAGTLSVERIPSIGEWVEKTSPPLAQAGDSGMAAHAGKLYTFGGANQTTSAALNRVQCYDPATDSWSSKANMPTAMPDVRAVTVGDDIWVFGNPSSPPQVFIYHPLTNTYTSPPGAVGFMGSLDPRTVVYIPDDGGFWAVQNNAFPAFENWLYRMDPDNQAAGWVATGPPRPGSYQLGSAVASSGRKAYFLPGGAGASPAHAFDAFTQTWTVIATPPIARINGKAAVYNGEVWWAGGSDASFAPIRKVELYDPDTNTWRIGPYDLASYSMNAIEPDEPLHPLYAYRDARSDVVTTDVMFEMFVPAPVELETEIEVAVDVYPFPWLQTAIEVEVDIEENLLTVPHARVLAPGFIHTGEE